ncbi:gephyrin-like molybdotransferase Glp [Agrilactobacillus yilanensis]|uniref:Molybdopterin molybdenumtransferase n=1 Tax=Agrilactobacillus yilanensis TaxID=2485997 RepID=A0ABW4JBT7_9LACO|nr:gephyrin-like molybdotransferase Glp [Agrilactobacillus yilanensis]
MIELEQALALIKQQITVQENTVVVTLPEALGRVTSSEIVAKTAVPNFARSGMDGYAIFAADTHTASPQTPVTLKVLGTVLAGEAVDQYHAQPGTAVKIMTGAPIPDGYDAVVRQELTDYGTETVTITRAMTKGKNFGPIGEDVAQGQVIFPKYTYLTCDSLAVLASLGYDSVSVLQPIRVGLIATGNELATPGQPLATGQIYNSSMYAIAARIRQSGGVVVFQEICQDDPQALAQLLTDYRDAVDVFLTTGGVSVGVKDFVPQVIESIGGKPLFHNVYFKPGTPVMGSVWQDKVILSLSGNPFAAIVNFQLLYWPLLAAFMNNHHFDLKRGQGKIVAGQMKSSKLPRYVRGDQDHGAIRIPANGHQSSVLHNVVAHNCLICQPPDQALSVGDEVTYLEWR